MKSGLDIFLPAPFQFVICYHPSINLTFFGLCIVIYLREKDQQDAFFFSLNFQGEHKVFP